MIDGATPLHRLPPDHPAAHPSRHRRHPRLRLHRRLERDDLRPHAHLRQREGDLPRRAALLRLQVLGRLRPDDGGGRARAHPRLPLLPPDPAVPGPGPHRRRREGMTHGHHRHPRRSGKAYGTTPRCSRHRPLDQRRRVHRPRRPLRLRQVHAAPHDRRPQADHRRHDRDRRPGGERPRPEGPRHRHGLPVLRALPAHDRRRQHDLQPAAQEGTEGHGRREAQGRLGQARPRRLPRPQAQGPLRRPAPARRQ